MQKTIGPVFLTLFILSSPAQDYPCLSLPARPTAKQEANVYLIQSISFFLARQVAITERVERKGSAMSAVVRQFYLKKEAVDKEVTKNSGE
jgi:hypothetical protein